MKPQKETAERYFLKYAYPCAFVLLEAGRITKKESAELERKLLNGEEISRSKLERTFTAAFRRIKKLASKMNRDYWDMEVMREYWLNGGHNEIIGEKEGNYKFQTEEFKDLCRIHKAKILEVKEQSFIVEYENNKREVYRVLVPEARKGDRVTIHFYYAIEKV